MGFPKPTASFWEGYMGSGHFRQNVSKSWIYTEKTTTQHTITFNIYDGCHAITLGGGGAGYAKLYYCDIYDLTEKFGAGNEPSLEWCDLNLKNTISWSGTYTP